ncbi:MAG: hypothetical protein F6K50_35240 [Moorea sp. SIO3I7]|nr:hypothetical protein [Moorena sp. SIO3I7]
MIITLKTLLPAPYSLLPAPYSLLPAPYSLFPIPSMFTSQMKMLSAQRIVTLRAKW